MRGASFARLTFPNPCAECKRLARARDQPPLSRPCAAVVLDRAMALPREALCIVLASMSTALSLVSRFILMRTRHASSGAVRASPVARKTSSAVRLPVPFGKPAGFFSSVGFASISFGL